MNTNTTLTIKTPKKLRDDAKRVAGSLGIPLTIAVNTMLRQFVRDKAITVSAHPEIRPGKLREWNRISKSMDKGHSKVFSNVEDLIEHLGLEK